MSQTQPNSPTATLAGLEPPKNPPAPAPAPTPTSTPPPPLPGSQVPTAPLPSLPATAATGAPPNPSSAIATPMDLASVFTRVVTEFAGDANGAQIAVRAIKAIMAWR